MVREEKHPRLRGVSFHRRLFFRFRPNRFTFETLLQRQPPASHLAHNLPRANLRFIVVRGKILVGVIGGGVVLIIRIVPVLVALFLFFQRTHRLAASRGRRRFLKVADD